MSDRYYAASSLSDISPSGNYIIINSVSAGYIEVEVEVEDEVKEFKDKAYCSVVDMRDGCTVRDWDGWACTYKWDKKMII